MRDFNLNKDEINSEEKEPSVDMNSMANQSSDSSMSAKKDGPDMLQKLSTILFIAICLITVAFAMRYFQHSRTLSKYAVPQDAFMDDMSGENSEEEKKEETKYVDEVVYNPSDTGNLLAEAQNLYNQSGDLNELGGETIWFSGSGKYDWKFMSGYDYKSADIDCVWICTSKDDNTILAYRTAIYRGADKVFENATTYLTKEGGNSLAAD